jgi:hypothetical protein
LFTEATERLRAAGHAANGLLRPAQRAILLLLLRVASTVAR